MFSTQQAILIEDIKDDLIFLKDGSAALILNTTAVNFGLLFETEQMAIINAFAQLLNSLSFPIQIVIRSKKMDITSYLNTLDKALKTQTNPLLAQLTLDYRHFVEGLIKENDVLDKQFYVCLNVSSLEMGIISKQSTDRIRKSRAMLETRRDLILRQLNRIGLKAKQLTTANLIDLFYDIYNPDNWYFSTSDESVVEPKEEAKEKESLPQVPQIPSQLKRIIPQTPIVKSAPQTNPSSPLRPLPYSVQTIPQPIPKQAVQQPVYYPPIPQQNTPQTSPLPNPTPQNKPLASTQPQFTPIPQNPPQSTLPHRGAPFIVEELNDDFGP